MAKRFLYFERQQAALCGVHALNNLCQGPYFTVGQLADIAHELDAKERDLMLSMGVDTADAIRFVAEDSGNVSLSGNFSLQVLREAFSRKFSVDLIDSKHKSIGSLNNASTEQSAFICNLEDHWFALRRIGNTWWNLNSLFPRPQRLGDLYLAAFLSQLQSERWRIFVVRGKLPPQAATVGHPPQFWHRVEDLLKPSSRTAAPSHCSHNQDLELALALSRSLADTPAPSPVPSPAPSLTTSLTTSPAPSLTTSPAPSLTPSLTPAPSPSLTPAPTHPTPIVVIDDYDEDDADLATAIALSLGDHTAPP